MTSRARHLLVVAVAAALAAPTTAMATNGYFSHGYGVKASSMGGAGVAFPQDSIAAATNPAGMGLIGNRFDVGLQIFNPNRSAELDPRTFGGTFKVDEDSGSEWFPIPEFGYNRMINDRLSVGISVFGNGGLNTSYDRNLYDETAAVLGAFQQGFGAALAGGATPQQAQLAGAQAAASVPEGFRTGTPDTGALGVDLAQLLITPTVAYKINDMHTVGVSAVFGLQRFKARGLGNFQCFTQTGFLQNGAGAPGTACGPGGGQGLTPGFIPSSHLTNNGYDYSYGAGVRIGWVGKIHPAVTLGATWASKVYMTEFDDYEELFAEDGDFDIPSNFALGIAVQATPKLTFAFDYLRILYGDVDSISNKGPVFDPQFGTIIPAGSGLLGQDNGLGFGWEDINIYKFGVNYAHNEQWTFRAGFNYGQSPIPDSQLLFNILAPATIKRHLTFGLTYSPDKSSEINAFYMHAFHEEQSSSVTAFGVPGEIEMDQNAFGVSYGLKF